MKPHASFLVELGVPLLALVVVSLLAVLIRRVAGSRSALVFALSAGAWLSITALLGARGFFAERGGAPPRIALLMLPTLALPVWLAFSRIGTALAGAPLALLIGLQSFRLPLELVMHQAASEGTMPVQMTFTGANFDIVTGTSALIVALLAARGWAPRWLLVGWNALGSALLLTILAIAIASLPAFAAFGREPARLNTWVAYFPFVWLPAGLVSVALLGHVLLWRRLLSRGMRRRAYAPIS